MMKTTIATVAVAALATTAAAEAAVYSTETTLVQFIAIDACKLPAVASVFGATPYGTNFVRLDGAEADVTACVEAIKGTVTTDADACFVTTGEDEAAVTTFVAGADKICPVASGSACKKAEAPAAADFCQAKDAATEVACTADKCAFIAPAKALQVTAKFKQWYKDPASTKTPPQPIIDAQVKAATDCGIKAPSTGYPTDAKGRTVVSISTANADCDVAAYKKTIQDAVDAWNKDAANKENQFTGGEISDVKLVDVPAACYDAVENTFLCATTKDCAWKCADETVCEADSVCGSGKCQAPAAAFVAQQAATKKCWSNAVASVVAPVIAAAVAIAFF